PPLRRPVRPHPGRAELGRRRHRPGAARAGGAARPAVPHRRPDAAPRGPDGAGPLRARRRLGRRRGRAPRRAVLRRAADRAGQGRPGRAGGRAGRAEGAGGVLGGAVPRPGNPAGPAVAVVLEADRPHVAQELLSTAAELAEELDGHVVALAEPGEAAASRLGAWGADELVVLTGPPGVVLGADDVAGAVAE